jgi:hypothetical protein
MSRVSPPRGYIDHEQPAFPASPPRRRKRRSRGDQLLEMLRLFGIRRAFLAATVLIEITLLLIALVPQSIWVGLGYPSGPIPSTLAPLVAGAFYLLPALTGALCQSWKLAVVLATLPAWLDLGIFAIAAAGRTGPFYLVSDPHAVSTVGTLELFAVLGALGWLARTSLLAVLKPRKGGGS